MVTSTCTLCQLEDITAHRSVDQRDNAFRRLLSLRFLIRNSQTSHRILPLMSSQDQRDVTFLGALSHWLSIYTCCIYQNISPLMYSQTQRDHVSLGPLSHQSLPVSSWTNQRVSLNKSLQNQRCGMVSRRALSMAILSPFAREVRGYYGSIHHCCELAKDRCSLCCFLLGPHRCFSRMGAKMIPSSRFANRPSMVVISRALSAARGGDFWEQGGR